MLKEIKICLQLIAEVWILSCCWVGYS